MNNYMQKKNLISQTFLEIFQFKESWTLKNHILGIFWGIIPKMMFFLENPDS